jgi:predicted aldo/keto reductase-like oxidoreductase
MFVERAASYAMLNRALDHRISFIETGSMYGDSEVKIGEVMKTRRDECFLSTKVQITTREDVAQTIERSLNRLKTDRIDLVMAHKLMDFGTLRKMLEPDGALSALVAAKDAGKISFIGVTSHVPEVHLKAIDLFPFDVIYTFTNYVDRFLFPLIQNRLIPVARERGIGVIGMKVFGKGRLKNSIPSALRYALSQPICSATIGMGSIAELDENVRLAKQFAPLEEAETERLYEGAPELGIDICRLCNKCLPCPEDIDIPAALRIGHLDDQVWYGTQGLARALYAKLPVKPDACTNCGDCEPRCPYEIPIRWHLRNTWMKLTPPEQIPRVFLEIQTRAARRPALRPEETAFASSENTPVGG